MNNINSIPKAEFPKKGLSAISEKPRTQRTDLSQAENFPKSTKEGNIITLRARPRHVCERVNSEYEWNGNAQFSFSK